MEHGLLIHIIHVAGTRMIDQGTDGCSRGFLMEGVMAGTDMLYFVDLGKTAIQRHPPAVGLDTRLDRKEGPRTINPGRVV